jgi:uncharacterized repeat protein (TIGR01451 family)
MLKNVTEDNRDSQVKSGKAIARQVIVDQAIGAVPTQIYKLYDTSVQNYQVVSDDLLTRYEGYYAMKYLNQYLPRTKYAPVNIPIRTVSNNEDSKTTAKFAFKSSNSDIVVAVWRNNDMGNAIDPLTTGQTIEVSLPDYGVLPQYIIDTITGDVGPAPSFTQTNGKLTLQNLKITDHPRLIRLSKIAQPAISFKQTIDKSGTLRSGDTVTYTLTAVNKTPALAKNIKITSPIPDGTTYVDGSASDGGALVNGILTWKLPTLPSDNQVTFKVQVK